MLNGLQLSFQKCDQETTQIVTMQVTDKQLNRSDWWPGHHHPQDTFLPLLSPLIVLRHMLTNETISQSPGQHRSLILHPYLESQRQQQYHSPQPARIGIGGMQQHLSFEKDFVLSLELIETSGNKIYIVICGKEA